ncbi:MAG: hypothetical protein IJ207_04300 [Treponema sp.]|uniref:hypothetical protein n=1 Tax=Treponema sp. TaxID=166 RepID=UPI0025FCD217|nr:hypothetical protein [Treponema sp.]MBQ9281403.1 hypothetical protein [Treponema sp.]
MKQFLASFLCVFLLVSCESAPSVAVQRYRDDGLPAWVGQSFTNPNDYWAGFNDETGYYSYGEAQYGDRASSTAAAELDAKIRLVEFISSEKKRRMNGTSINGVLRVDRFIAENGTVYVLVFVSKKNADKAFR